MFNDEEKEELLASLSSIAFSLATLAGGSREPRGADMDDNGVVQTMLTRIEDSLDGLGHLLANKLK